MLVIYIFIHCSTSYNNNDNVFQQLLGINGFTYLLAGLIIMFLSLNAFLGPGWLGQLMGVEGTGTFTQVSDSLPGTIDLNSSENLL